MDLKQYEYFAFISYKREDGKWAKWLQGKLEYYKLPSCVKKDNPDLPNRIRPIFKDTTDLEPGFLTEKIQHALHSSKYLIVICSPRSAHSAWVNKEVQEFIDKGCYSHIIPFIIEGIPNAMNPQDECFPESLRLLNGKKELLGANINEMGRDAAVIKVVARMFNLRFDSLWQRHEKGKKKKRLLYVMASVALLLISTIIIGYIANQNSLLNAANTAIQANRARAVAEKAKREIAYGNVKDAMLALLMVSPCSNNYQYIPEVDAALRTALDSINANNYNYQMISGNVNSLLVSSDGKRFVQILKDNTLECYDSNTLECIKSMKLPYVEYVNVYLSQDGRYFLLQDSNSVYYYDIDKSQQINRFYTDRLLDYQVKELKNRFLDLNKTVKGDFLGYKVCKDIQGFPKCDFINDKLGIAVIYYKIEDGFTDNEGVTPIGLYELYDIRRCQSLCKRYDYDMYESDYQITSMDLSPDGRYWAIAYTCGDVEVFDVKTKKSKVWKHPEVSGHYSNQISFSGDSKLLFQTHAFQDCINILNVQNMYLADSIYTKESPEGATVYQLQNNILCCSSNRTFLYTKGKQSLETIYKKNEYNIDDKRQCISIKNKSDIHIYNVIKIHYNDSSLDMSQFEQATGHKIKIETDGISVWNSSSGEIIWRHDNIMETYPLAFTSDYCYGFVLNHAYRGGDYISILEMSEGIPIIDMLCNGIDDIYYTENEGLIFIKDYNENLIVRKFPLYKDLLSECLKITNGMNLSMDKRKMFFLE